MSIISNREYERADYSVVVKGHSRLVGQWRWEIYRAGRKTPIDRSGGQFSTMSEANRAGRNALLHLLKALNIA